MFQLTTGMMLLGIAAGADAAPASQPAIQYDLAALKRQGAFGFPQTGAETLCDTDDLRVSIWNNKTYLYVQAVLWKDGDAALGETRDGRPIGDNSQLCLDVDADQKITAKVDRDYALNPWPVRPGLRYSIHLGNNSTTHIMNDSKGRGAISYLEVGKNRKVRVDSFLIPLAEIEKKSGEEIRLVYCGSSTKPEMGLNSTGFSNTKASYSNPPAKDKYHSIKLQDRSIELDPRQVPEGREDQVPATTRPSRPAPKPGTVPPELAAKDWLHTEKAPTLANLRGKVVLIDFWATWCGPCVAGIPHLNDLHDKYGSKGLVILGITDQSRRGMKFFIKSTPMKYIVGTGSDLAPEYGVSGFPHAFIIGRDGKLAWEGNPGSEDFDKQLIHALESRQ